MNDHEFERAFRAWSQAEASQPASQALHERVRSVPLTSPATRSWLPHPLQQRFTSMFTATKIVVAAAVVALFGGLLLPALVPQRDDASDPAAVATSAASPHASPMASPTQAPSPSPTDHALPTARRLAGNGPVLAWEQIDVDVTYAASVTRDEGGFVMLDDSDENAARVRESLDGRSWSERAPTDLERAILSGGQAHELGDGYVIANEGWSSLRYYGPDGSQRCTDAAPEGQPCPSPIPKGRIQRVATSPVGVVVLAWLDPREVVADVFGDDVAQGDWRWLNDDPPRNRAQTVWRLRTDDGKTHEVDLGDHGLYPDSADWVFVGWYSPDGVAWTRIPRLHGEYVYGSDEGFWMPGAGLWYSRDGLTWERVGADRGELSVWPGRGGLVVTQDAGPIVAGSRVDKAARFLSATPAGIAELPMSRRTRRSLQQTPRWTEPSIGPLGIVATDEDAQTILYSRDGKEWGVSRFPAAWRVPEAVDDGPGRGRYAATWITVGDDAVVAVRGRCTARRPTADRCGFPGAASGTVPWEWTLWVGSVAVPR